MASTNQKRRTDYESVGEGLESSGGKRANLPLTSALPDQSLMDLVNEMLTEAKALKLAVDGAEGRLEEIKTDLAALIEPLALPGVRYGDFCFEFNGYKTRRTLSAESLLENGVTKAQIDASYKTSKPYLDVRFAKVPR